MSQNDPQAVVTAMCMALESGDLEQVLPYLADDVLYHNIPWAPVHGHDGVRRVLGGIFAAAERPLKEMQIQRTVADGNVVMNVRLERWDTGRAQVDLPVAGLFEVADGRITRWCDYFDSAAAERLMDG